MPIPPVIMHIVVVRSPVKRPFVESNFLTANIQLPVSTE
jgi:hypothetical protein